jgi:hypothetical protein
LAKERRPKELREWVLAKCGAISDVPQAREPALLRRRPFDKFYKELWPLSRFVALHYGDRDDIWCTPNLDNDNFDAEIREPTRTIKIEITQAWDPDEHRRMQFFVKHGHVCLTGPVTADGNVDVEGIDHMELRARHLCWVKQAAEKKAYPRHYGRNYELLVAVEDWWANRPADTEEIGSFVEREVLALQLDFDYLHIVGLNKLPLLSFALGS